MCNLWHSFDVNCKKSFGSFVHHILFQFLEVREPSKYVYKSTRFVDEACNDDIVRGFDEGFVTTASDNRRGASKPIELTDKATTFLSLPSVHRPVTRFFFHPSNKLHFPHPIKMYSMIFFSCFYIIKKFTFYDILNGGKILFMLVFCIKKKKK